MKKNVVIILLVILVLGLGGYLVYDKVITSDKSEKESSKVSEKSIKIDDTKEYVYDAEYYYEKLSDDIEKTKYSYNEFEVYGSPYFEDLKVPYINIDTEDAKTINSKLQSLYIEYATKFDEFAECHENENYPCGINFLTYKTYYTEDTVSIVVIYAIYGTDIPFPEYLGYTFSLETGKLLSLDDIAKTKNITKDELIEKSKTAIEEYTKNNNECSESKFINDDYEYVKNNISLQGEVKRAEEKSGYEGLIYFIDSDNNINLVTNILVECHAGYYPHLLTLK